MRILVAEQDPALATFLERSFVASDYAVDVAPEDRTARSLAQQVRYDAAILDLNSPIEAALDVLRQVRASQPHLPILILTSAIRPTERVQLLDLGTDDLVFKPFSFSELSARVRALLRRRGDYATAVLRVEDLELSRLEHSVKRGGRKIGLTPKEFALLEYLMSNAGQRVTRAQIIQHVWNLSFDTMTNVVDVYINYLRKKVDKSFDRRLIHTVRGVGYQLQGLAPPAASGREL